MRSTLINVRQWFRIEESERSWLLMLSGGVFFLSGANVFLWSLLQSMLVKRSGVEFLPYFYIFSSVSLVIGGWISMKWLRRWRSLEQSLLFAFTAFFGVLILALGQQFFSVRSGPIPMFVFVAFGLLVNGVAMVGALDKLYIMAAELFNIEQLQRMQPLLESIMAVSTFIAGLVLGILAEKVSSTTLFLLVVVAVAVTAPFYAALRKEMGKQEPSASFIEAEQKNRKSLHGRGLSKYFQNPRTLRFLYALGFIVGLSMIFSRIFGYQFIVAADVQYTSEGELNSFIGWYTALLSLSSLVFINSIQRVLIKRYGMTINMFVPPLVVMTGVIATIIVPAFPVVILSVYYRDIAIQLQQAAYYIMLGGMSDYQRNQAWSWLNGKMTMIGGLVGSAVVAGLTIFYRHGSAENIIRILGSFALFFLLIRLFFTVRLRRSYPSVLLNSLQQGDIKTRLRAMETMAEFRFMKDHHLGAILDVIRDEVEPTALRIASLRTVAAIEDASILRVVSRLLNHRSPELRIEAIRTLKSFRYLPEQLRESGFSRFVMIAKLHDVFRKERNSPETVNEILEALIVLRDPDIIPLIVSCLQDQKPEIRHGALHSLRQFNDPAIIDYVKPFLSDANLDLRAQAVAAVWQFPWERESSLENNIDDLLRAPAESEKYRQGLYLIGVLHLKDRREIPVKALQSKKNNIRLTAAGSLLKLGDESGVAEIERTLRQGTAEETHEIQRLEFHRDVPLLQQRRIRSLVHKYHLHYPANLPVSEPLRVRMIDIPKACLISLLAYYQAPESMEDRRKIESALTETKLPSVRGKAVLMRMDSPWREMASVALLAKGIQTSSVDAAAHVEAGTIIIGNAGDPDLPDGAFTLGEITKVSDRQIMKQHYAPSELISVICKFRPELFPPVRIPGNRLRSKEKLKS
ncbi:MAG: HEAT repeat domain-containing protein [Patescibacteria group bacterium]